jgi:GTP-binding protein
MSFSIAIIGRPNVGKSTLFNRLVGQKLALVDDLPGVTRDRREGEARLGDLEFTIIDTAGLDEGAKGSLTARMQKGRDFRVFDTAGLRRRSRIEEKLEKLSVADALRAVRFAEVVVMMMDSQNRFEEQDLRITDLIEREGRAVVLAVNKWDLMETKGGGAISGLRRDADHWLPQLKGVPIVAVSGLMGEGIDRLMQAIQDAYALWNRRVSTSALNRWFEQAVQANPPPAVSGRRLKLNYITQTKARPPSFVLFCSRADAVPQSYLRYLINSMREAFDLPGTPVRITLREKANPFAHKRKRPS